ncbi:MAG: SusC/RagA family TonB-linked outer membrane protein [Bacteroidota bacterium]|nr:SusC/RagA family TonB-linked outer membrane protein [Bacteroidota bacterium]
MNNKKYDITLNIACVITLLLFSMSSLLAQNTINGSVTDSNGKEILSVNITSKGNNKPIKVDFKGHFTYTTDKMDTLVIIKEGFQKQEIMVNQFSQNVIIKLEENKPFQNKLVLPFGVQINNEFFTGAISGISGNEMEKSHTPNATNSVAGRIPGLYSRADYSDEPGNDGASFYVRGYSSYNYSNDSPNLYVDNVPVSFSQLDPLEIDQLQVLKDGVANGVYGIGGANKSIFVTTKRGEAYNNKINFYSSVVFQKPVALPTFVGAQKYMQLYNEAALNDGLPAKYTQSQIDAYNNGSDPINNPDADWYGANLKDYSVMQKHNLTISGGNNILRYFILGGITSQNGLFKNTSTNFDKYGYKTQDQFNRYNLRSNFDANITKSLSAFVDLSARIEENTNPDDYSGATSDIITNMAKYPPNLFPVVFSDGTIGGNAQYPNNPYGMITKLGYYKDVNRVTFGNVGFKEVLSSVLKGLSVSAAYSFYNSFTDSEGFNSGSPTFAVNSYINGVLQTVGKNVLPTYTVHSGAQNHIGTFWGKVDYSAIISQDHKLSASLGYSQSKTIPNGADFPYTTVNLFSQEHYQYKDCYLVDLGLSYSTTEVFNNHYGFFPSLGAGWIISKENFMKDLKMVNFLKLRGSYAILGNGDISGSQLSRYLYVSRYNNTGTVYNFGQTTSGANGFAEGALANMDVTWEKMNMANIGIDASLCNNTLGFSLDLFNERRSRILTTPGNISSLVGQTTQQLNIGIVNNHGLDANIWFKKEMKDFSYHVSANLSLNANKIIYNAESVKQYAYLNTTGQPVGTVYGLTAIGFYANNEDIANSPKSSYQQVKPGDIKYLDRNGDNVIDNNDFAPISKPWEPQTTLGLELGGAYKNFDLSIYLQGSAGYGVDLRSYATYGFTNGSRPSDLMNDRWTPSTASTALYPRLGFDGSNNYQTSTFWVKTTRFIRLKNVEIGYNLTSLSLQRLKIKALRFYLSGLNLATWSNLNIKYIDPEDAQAGISQYPRMESLSLGLNIQL